MYKISKKYINLNGKLYIEPLSQQEKLLRYDDYLINFETHVHERRTQAKERIYYDKKINPLVVKIGDNVFLLKGGKIIKLDSHYTLIEIIPYFIDMVALSPYLFQTGIFNQNDCNIPTWSRNLNNPDTIKDNFSTKQQEDRMLTKTQFSVYGYRITLS